MTTLYRESIPTTWWKCPNWKTFLLSCMGWCHIQNHATQRTNARQISMSKMLLARKLEMSLPTYVVFSDGWKEKEKLKKSTGNYWYYYCSSYIRLLPWKLLKFWLLLIIKYCVQNFFTNILWITKKDCWPGMARSGCLTNRWAETHSPLRLTLHSPRYVPTWDWQSTFRAHELIWSPYRPPVSILDLLLESPDNCLFSTH